MPAKISQRFFEAVGLVNDVIDFEISANRPDCMSILGLRGKWRRALNVRSRRFRYRRSMSPQPTTRRYALNLDLCPRTPPRVMGHIHVGDSPHLDATPPPSHGHQCDQQYRGHHQLRHAGAGLSAARV